MDVKSKITDKAKEIGFDVVGFASPLSVSSDIAGLKEFIAQGRQGDMDWLAREDGKRGSPLSIMPGAKTIISLGLNYGPSVDPTKILEYKTCGAISVYASGKDYHKVFKRYLKKLARWMSDEFSASAKIFVDTAPIMEKPIAVRAGIGWQGKHTNLVSQKFGSWLFLGEIFTDLSLTLDVPETDHCGKCDACLKACPTGALDEPYQIDARKCISYLTIEHKGKIMPELMDKIGNRVYGCDDCLAACPWTKFTEVTSEAEFDVCSELNAPQLAYLASLDEESFRKLFSGSAVKRTGRERFVRNVMIAIGNSGDHSLYSTAKRFSDDPSPLISETARRACKLLDKKV